MFSNELKIMKLRARQKLLMARDPVTNEKLVKKIERVIRNLEK